MFILTRKEQLLSIYSSCNMIQLTISVLIKSTCCRYLFRREKYCEYSLLLESSHYIKHKHCRQLTLLKIKRKLPSTQLLVKLAIYLNSSLVEYRRSDDWSSTCIKFENLRKKGEHQKIRSRVQKYIWNCTEAFRDYTLIITVKVLMTQAQTKIVMEISQVIFTISLLTPYVNSFV